MEPIMGYDGKYKKHDRTMSIIVVAVTFLALFL